MRASFFMQQAIQPSPPYPSCLSFLTPPSFGQLPYMANATQRRSVTHFILLLQFGELLCNKLFNFLPYNCIVKHPVRLRDTAGRRFKSLLSRYWALPDNDIKNGAVKLLRGIKWDRGYAKSRLCLCRVTYLLIGTGLK